MLKEWRKTYWELRYSVAALMLTHVVLPGFLSNYNSSDCYAGGVFVSSLLLLTKQPQTFSAFFAHLEQRFKSCNSHDDFNKCVCESMSMCMLDALLLPFPLLQLSVAWPLTWSFDLTSADCYLVVQLWNRIDVCVHVCQHICALSTSWRSCAKAWLSHLFVSS